MGAAKQANETSREELLTRDVHILFCENRALKDRIKELEKRNGILEKELIVYKKQDEEENGTPGEVAFYIKNIKESLKLSYDQMSRIFDIPSTTIQRYAKGEGNIFKARAFAERLREFRKEYGKNK